MKKKTRKQEIIVKALAERILPPDRTWRTTKEEYLEWLAQDSSEENYFIQLDEVEMNGSDVKRGISTTLKFMRDIFNQRRMGRQFVGFVLHRPSNITCTLMWIPKEQEYSLFFTKDRPMVDPKWPEAQRYDLLIRNVRLS